MKISNNKIGGPLPGKAENAKSAKTEGADGLKQNARVKGQSTADLQSGAKVALSERAQMMGKAREIASQPSDIDEAKVARLQKMIDEGSYKVDADKIADKLVDDHMLIPD